MADAGKTSLTVIGADTQIRGEMLFESSARILGKFDGHIASKGEVQIGETANVKASIEANTIVVDGPVQGDLTARQSVHLSAKAVVQGDIVAATLVVVEGASFVGHCRVGPDALKMVSENPKQSAGRSAAETQSAGAENGRRAPVTPVAQAKGPNLAVAADLEATLAGLESKLAGIGKAKVGVGE